MVGRRAGTRRDRGVRSSGDDPGPVGLGPDAMTGSAVGAAFFCLGLSTVLPGSAPSMPAEARSRQAGSPSRVTRGRRRALPRRDQIGRCQLDLEAAPAGRHEDRRVLARRASSTTSGSVRRVPERADAADDVPGRAFRLGRVGQRRLPAAGPRRPGASGRARRSTGTTARTSRPSTRATSVLNTRPGSIPRASAASSAVARARVAVPAVRLRRLVLVDGVRARPAPDDDVERAGPGGGAFHGLGVDR